MQSPIAAKRRPGIGSAIDRSEVPTRALQADSLDQGHPPIHPSDHGQDRCLEPSGPSRLNAGQFIAERPPACESTNPRARNNAIDGFRLDFAIGESTLVAHACLEATAK
eukprot:370464-Rhodomonas_salina.4